VSVCSDVVTHESYEAAMTAKWGMAQRGVDTTKLRPEKCSVCNHWHLRRVGIEPVSFRNNHYFECRDCGHEWMAPIGRNCPKCGSEVIQDMGPRHIGYIRA